MKAGIVIITILMILCIGLVKAKKGRAQRRSGDFVKNIFCISCKSSDQSDCRNVTRKDNRHQINCGFKACLILEKTDKSDVGNATLIIGCLPTDENQCRKKTNGSICCRCETDLCNDGLTCIHDGLEYKVMKNGATPLFFFSINFTFIYFLNLI